MIIDIIDLACNAIKVSMNATVVLYKKTAMLKSEVLGISTINVVTCY